MKLKPYLFEFGPGSGLSGVSGVSAESANSALSSSNNNLTRSQKNQHQLSSMHQQIQQPFDRLSLSENRGQQISQQMQHVPMNNYAGGTKQEDQFLSSQYQKQSEIPYKSAVAGANYTIGQQQTSGITLKNYKSVSEQNSLLKKNLVTGGTDSNTQSKLSVK